MSIFSQQSQPWAPVRLGSSQWTMQNSGCIVTDIANALSLAGYRIDPLQAISALNSAGAFTPGGLLYFARVSQAFPQFSLDPNGAYQFVEVRWGADYHWLLRVGDTYYDPWNAATLASLPGQYSQPLSAVRASIAAVPPVITLTVQGPDRFSAFATPDIGVKVRSTPHAPKDNGNWNGRKIMPGPANGFWFVGTQESDGILWLVLENSSGYVDAAYTTYNPTSNA